MGGAVNRLDPKVRLLWLLRWVVLAVVAGLVLGAVDGVLPPSVARVLPSNAPLVASSGLLVLGLVLTLLRYRLWRWEVRGDSLYLERGVFTRVRTVVPFVRIQHVDTSRAPGERVLGLASTVVYTAGSRGADVTIPGLAGEGADDLRERLKRLAIRAESEDAV